jgi:3-deoxy-D-manno-octulosonate 8-phosphate phosphatase (KDO 8-P phosphatase)
MRQCALSAAPADADAWIRARVDIVTEAPGGFGAVREFCERLLAARGLLEAWRAGYQ